MFDLNKRILLFGCNDDIEHLLGSERKRAETIVRTNHYTHSIPSGKSHWFLFRRAIVSFSIPANRFAAKVCLGRDGNVWELTRLWAPDDHERNLLTQAISASVRLFKDIEPEVEALISYADPNAGHGGGVYQAASWVYQGQSTENRAYVDATGQTFARRKFHSGNRHMNKAEIEAMGFTQLKLPGKHRYAFGLNRQTRRIVSASSKAYPKNFNRT